VIAGARTAADHDGRGRQGLSVRAERTLRHDKGSYLYGLRAAGLSGSRLILRRAGEKDCGYVFVLVGRAWPVVTVGLDGDRVSADGFHRRRGGQGKRERVPD
jgi:hypothetical protein